MGKRMKNPRPWVQAGWTLLTNSYATGFLNGAIYQGKTKALCVPGLNCYSCPGARGSCPVGALQASLNGNANSFPFYVFGTLLVFGALLGRFICGWLCPFGWIQELLFKLPPRKKWRRLRLEPQLRKLPYAVLLVFVLLLPIFLKGDFGIGVPWFCKLICPAGTLMGAVPLLALNEALRSSAGWLFIWKFTLLTLLVALCLKLYRPFCRYLCPLGAFYGLMNPISIYRMHVDSEKCTRCSHCRSVCEMDIPVYQTPNAAACIRCGSCVRACPQGALRMGFGARTEKQIPSRTEP